MQTVSVDQLSKLYENGLYGSLKLLASFQLSLSAFTILKDDDFQTAALKYQILILYGDSLYKEGDYKMAELQYCDALKLRKSLDRIKSQQRQLESIDQKQRTSQINMMLAKLYQKHGMERSAITCYKDVLRLEPLALEAATALLDLGTPLQEVQSLVCKIGAPSFTPEWLIQYIKGYASVSLNKNLKALQVFKPLENQTLKNNPFLIAQIAESYFKAGDIENAKLTYERIRLVNKYYIKGMDIYAQLLADDNQKSELQMLSQDLLEINDQSVECWVTLAYYSFCCAQKARAVYFAQKAHVTDVTNIQALLLKASLLHSLNKTQEALIHFREAIRLDPKRFDSYSGLVDCHISTKKLKDGLFIARNAHKTIGTNARTLTLCAKVYAEETQTLEKAKSMLKKALSSDASYVPATIILAEVLIKEKLYNEAEQVLNKQLAIRQTSTLYRLAGDCMKLMGKIEDGIIMYDKALRLDPDNAQALDGLHGIDRNSTTGELDLSDIVGREPRDRSSMEDVELASGVDWID
ncbi:anaphase-promoting complex subunit 7 isoform X2 [Hydra vulgaris]|uniref:anaphase-promoting complex subunit 7 isoform X2 n=1 Tax=Hydra vulgaris TaxID=6087 RepID=UPI001F5EDEC0|nr:anaphase-promoting complex subunit 7 isoform X2 [Hydra vulgaris]